MHSLAPTRAAGAHPTRTYVWLGARYVSEPYLSCAPQRCVRYFDHHCGVFGRCIAGRHKTLLTKGNMRFYYGVWVCLGVGAISSVMAAMLGLG